MFTLGLVFVNERESNRPVALFVPRTIWVSRRARAPTDRLLTNGMLFFVDRSGTRISPNTALLVPELKLWMANAFRPSTEPEAYRESALNSELPSLYS